MFVPFSCCFLLFKRTPQKLGGQALCFLLAFCIKNAGLVSCSRNSSWQPCVTGAAGVPPALTEPGFHSCKAHSHPAARVGLGTCIY